MDLLGEQLLLRIYLRSTDQYHLAPAYERLVQKARAAGLAGATVLKGVAGFYGGELLAPSAWHLSERVPVIVELVDAAERIVPFVTTVVPAVLREGMVTLERAAVLRYRAGANPAAPEGEAGGEAGGGGGGVVLHGSIEPLSSLPTIALEGPMKTAEDGVLLRVFIGDSDQAGGEPLYRAIVLKARELGLRGATVLRGALGYGAHSVVHTAKIETLSTDLPLVIELVDSREKIAALLPHLEQMVNEGMITMEDVRIVLYRHG